MMTTKTNGLIAVLRDVIQLLLAGDFECVETKTGSSVGYVFGVAEVERRLGVTVPRSARKRTTATTPLGEAVYRGLVGEASPKKLVTTRRRLIAEGVPPELLDEIEAARGKPKSKATSVLLRAYEFGAGSVDDPRFEDWQDYFESAIVERLLTPEQMIALAAGQWEQVGADIEFLLVEELGKRLNKVPKRLSTLPYLGFANTLLAEATRCWLYGYNRAAVVLSASAVEVCFKENLGLVAMERLQQDANVRRLSYPQLVDAASERGILRIRSKALDKRSLNRLTKAIFQLRNDVAHEGADPGHEKAGIVLTVAREVVAALHRPS